jgi:hypothetical protein
MLFDPTKVTSNTILMLGLESEEPLRVRYLSVTHAQG